MKNFLFKKPFCLSVALISLIAVILRFFQLATNVDSVTGFYKNAADTGRIAFIIIIVIAFIFGFVWRYLAKKKAILPINMKFDFSKLFGERIILAAVAIGFAVNTFYEIFRIKNPLPSLLLPGAITAFAVITSILSALSLVYFIVLSFLIENKQLGTSFLSIVTVAWVVFRILRDFISFTTIVYISENLLDIIFLCFLLITLFAVCRLLSDSDTKKGYNLFALFAPATIVLGFVLSIPAILGFLCGFDSVGESDMFMHFVDLTLSVFILRVGMYVFSEN